MKKFDFVIGNPPYNEETADTSDNPVYNTIMEAAFKIADKAVFVTPARFLFDAGKTPKDFNQRMLNDPHFKVLDYAPDAKKYFKGVDIEGGVAITLHDENKNFGAIGTFIPFIELKSIHQKVCVDNENFQPLSNFIFTQNKWNLEKLFEDYPEYKSKIGSGGTERRLTTGIFSALNLFREDEQDGDIKILGLIKSKRVYRYVEEKYIDAPHENLSKYKVFVPKSNGSGNLYEVLSTPLVGTPLVGEPFVGCTQTFISVGAFDTRTEAEACLKYIKSKFARCMLGILKVTQHNPPATWAKVPLQDFTRDSDIKWDEAIDEQLYRKYKLSTEEINFIESHVKEMA